MRMTVRLLTLTLSMALAATAFGNEPAPEPPTDPLQKLKGTWTARAVLAKGQERKTTIVYAFDKDKATITLASGKGSTREMTLAADKKQKNLIEMTPKGGGRVMRYFFRFEKGELNLTPVRIGDKNPKPDFSGKTAPVLILRREKK